MKGINAMTTVMIVFLIALSIFSWISINQSVGSGEAAEFREEARLLEADRSIDKARLYIQSAFSMSAQRGTAEAANKSGRTGEDNNRRYWMCRGETQTPSIEEVGHAASNNTQEILDERLREIRGPRNNWIYDVSKSSCVETGHNEPMDSPENDYFSSAAKIDEVSLTDRNQEILRSREDYITREKIQYNRYWYMYSTLDEWVDEADLSESVSNKLEEVNSRHTRTDNQCKTNVTDQSIEDLCSGGTVDYGENGQYPEPQVCGTIAQKASQKATEGVQEALADLEEDYFDGQVSCNFEPNEDQIGNGYPGVNVDLVENKGTSGTGNNCGIARDDVKGEIYECITNWRHQFTAYVDGTIRCSDQKFRSVPGNDSLQNMHWKIDVSFQASGTGNDQKVACGTEGGNKPPLTFRECNVNSEETNSCELQSNLKGDLE